MKFIIIASFLFYITSVANAQEYCLQFSKEGKRTVLIKERRNISFVFENSSNWNKGKIKKITSDSLFIEQYIEREGLLEEIESNYIVKGYDLSKFRIMAYNNTPKAVGKSSAVVLVALMAVVGGGVELGNAFFNDDSLDVKVQKKFFKKNVNLEKGWVVEIVLCE